MEEGGEGGGGRGEETREKEERKRTRELGETKGWKEGEGRGREANKEIWGEAWRQNKVVWWRWGVSSMKESIGSMPLTCRCEVRVTHRPCRRLGASSFQSF